MVDMLVLLFETRRGEKWAWDFASDLGNMLYNIFLGLEKMSSIENLESSQMVEGRWADDEHLRFLAGIMQHGKDWKKVEKVVKSRNGSQVRSHAQKFFIKLAKIAKERKKLKNRELMEPSDIEREILSNFKTDSITDNTPSEITALIHKDWDAVSLSFTQKKRQLKPNKPPLKPPVPTPIEQDSDEEQNLLFEDMGRERLESPNSRQESFFIKIIKLNMQHFINGNDFRELIDMRKSNIEETESSTPCQRKRSFCLPHQEHNTSKLKETLQNLHRGLGSTG